MPRKPRVHFSGALYHVIVRGNNAEAIFALEDEKKKYLNTLKRYKDKFEFKLYAYAIMDNHAHLLIEVSYVPLSKIMQGIQQVYTQFYNRKHKRIGHVFHQRYKAILCDKDSYLLQLIRYIHQNPVKANLSETVNWTWTSHREYVGKPFLIDSDFILRLFDLNKDKAIRAYQRFVGDEEGEIQTDKCGALEVSYVIDPKRPPLENMPWVSLDDLLQKIIYITGQPVHYLSRRQSIVKARKAFVLLALKYCRVTQKEIADKIGVSPSYITEVINLSVDAKEDLNIQYLDEKVISEFSEA